MDGGEGGNDGERGGRGWNGTDGGKLPQVDRLLNREHDDGVAGRGAGPSLGDDLAADRRVGSSRDPDRRHECTASNRATIRTRHSPSWLAVYRTSTSFGTTPAIQSRTAGTGACASPSIVRWMSCACDRDTWRPFCSSGAETAGRSVTCPLTFRKRDYVASSCSSSSRRHAPWLGGAQRVRFLSSSPSPTTSPTASPTVWSSAIATVTASSGCPTAIRASGTITASGSGPVTYRWETPGVGTGRTSSVAFGSDAGSFLRLTLSTENYTSQAVGEGTYTVRLHILTPTESASETTYRVSCS